MSGTRVRSDEQALAATISAAILELDARSFGWRRATAGTYLEENIVLCVLDGPNPIRVP
jgi:hypothetical protein